MSHPPKSSQGFDPEEEELAAALRGGFAGRPAVPIGVLSKLLNLDEKTLLRHARAGRLPFRAAGTGRRRIMRRFTIGDAIQFFRNLQMEAPSKPASKTVVHRKQTSGGFMGHVPRPGTSVQDENGGWTTKRVRGEG